MISLRLLILTVVAILGALSLFAVFFALQGATSSLIISTVMVSIVAVPILVVITLRGVLDPLVRVKTTVRRIARGDYGIRFSPPVFREMRELVEDLNRMAETIEHGREKAEETQATLEVRVRARTRELQELAEGLERKVKERTKQLEEKIGELEKFQRLAVGRELKMIELKKKLKQHSDDNAKRD